MNTFVRGIRTDRLSKTRSNSLTTMKIKVEAIDPQEAKTAASATEEDNRSETQNVTENYTGAWSQQTGISVKEEDGRDRENYGNIGPHLVHSESQEESHGDNDVLNQQQQNVLDKDHWLNKRMKEGFGEEEQSKDYQRQDERVKDGMEHGNLEMTEDVETSTQERVETEEHLQVEEEELVDVRRQEKKQVRSRKRNRLGHRRSESKNRQKQKQVDELHRDESQSGESSSEAETASKKMKKSRRKSGKYSCPVCEKMFSSQTSLSKHKRLHKFTCVVCDREFKVQIELEGHVREHEGQETPYWCDTCDKKYQKLDALKCHRRSCGKSFECGECGKVFGWKPAFQEHMVTHTESNRFKCEICGRQLSSACNKRNHMVLHSDKKPFECVVCDKAFKFQKTLNYHMKNHTGKVDRYTEKIECDVCGKTFTGVMSLKLHMDIHNGLKRYECSICGKRFTQQSSRDGHERTHYNKTIRFNENLSKDQLKENVINSFDCSECLLSFSKQRYLDEHLHQAHNLIPGVADTSRAHSEFQCILCDMSFTSTAELNSHSLNVHCQVVESAGESNDLSTCVDRITSPSSIAAGRVISLSRRPKGRVTPPDKQYGCNLCNKTVTSKNVAHHMRNHGEKKFVCRVCGVTFSLMPNLTRHMTLHTSELPYGCKQCDKKFRTRESLKKHKVSHEGKKTGLVKKYGCDTCGKMFVDNYHLDRHKITHMKRHRCHNCKRSFVDVNIYEQHMKTHDAK